MESGDPTREHILPLSKGGDNRPENLVYACQACNVAVGNWEVDRKVFFRNLCRIVGGIAARKMRGKVNTMRLAALDVLPAEKTKSKPAPRVPKLPAGPHPKDHTQRAKAARHRAHEIAQIEDLTGRTFGKMTVETYSHPGGKTPGGGKRKGGPRWSCSCGALVIRTSKRIREAPDDDMCGRCDRIEYLNSKENNDEM